jgi:hypothetical protein
MSLIETARRHDEMVAATEAQRARSGVANPSGDRWSNAAARFTSDPHRKPDSNLQAVMDYVRPEHVVLDVGGGAGRYSLPLALQCREVIDIEPAAGMGAAFEASARDAGISNARWVGKDWLAADGVVGDVSLVIHVTYFVPQIVPFIEKLVSGSRERVIIGTCVTPPPNQNANMYEVINGEPMALVPDYRVLLPVLWDMGIVPDVRLLEAAEATALGGLFATREDALRAAVAGAPPATADPAAVIEARFDDLFTSVPGGFRRRPAGDPTMMLITWRTDR